MNSAVINFDVFIQNIHILDLAFDYLSIDPSEKSKIIEVLEQKFKENPDIKITEIFKQENLVSDEDIDCLSIFDEHLRTLSQDSQFGKLAIANKLASKNEVDKALEQQRDYFKKYRINMKLGDILVENNIISHTNRVSILLTQNRIKDENLFEALNDIGTTPLEKEAVNKRFGALAIKQKLVTIDQVNTALEIQEKEKNSQEKPRFLGQILQETANLSEDDLLNILLEQKQFEKRKLNLEKALYNVKSEIKISQKLNKLFEYKISRDGVEVYAKKLTETNQNIPTYEFLIWLKRAGIRFGIVKNSIIEDFIQNTDKKTSVLVAKGFPVEHCIHETVEFYFENEDAKKESEEKETSEKQTDEQARETEAEDQPSDATETEDNEAEDNEAEDSESEEDKDTDNSKDSEPDVDKPEDDKSDKDKSEKKSDTKDDIENESDEKDKSPSTDNETDAQEDKPDLVKRGTILARIIPGEKGKPGKDVLGYPINPQKPSTCILNADRGVLRKGAVFIAVIDGRPVLKNGINLSVEPIVEKTKIKTIKGSLNEDTKEIYESEIVELKGTLTPDAILRCHSLRREGDLVGTFICTGEIDVKGNIGTDQIQKGQEAIQETDITCHGSIKVSKSIINSKIQTAGELIGVNSKIAGSEIIAYKGIIIKDVVTDENNKPSILQFGLKPGDKSPVIDHTIEIKSAELPILRKEKEIDELTQEYEKERQVEENHLTEQAILKNIIEIIEAPELYQYDGLENKLKYLYGLPDFSSVKSFYLRVPETDAALAFQNQILMSTAKLSQDKLLEDLKKKIDPEPEIENEDEEPISKIEQIETQFKARLAAFEIEVKDKSGEIEKIENEIKELHTLKEKLNLIHLKSLHKSKATIKIKNACEKGTIIKGKIAQLVLERSIYKVEFKEIMNPKTKAVAIVIEAY